MSNVGNLEQQIANLQINHGDEAAKTVKPGKKIGPAVPPKPKKSQPQVNIPVILTFDLIIERCYYKYGGSFFSICMHPQTRMQQW